MSGVGVIREPRGIATELITKNSTLWGWNFRCTSRVHAKVHVSLRSISGIIVSRLNFPSVQYDSISGSARKANREIVLAREDIVLSTCRILSKRTLPRIRSGPMKFSSNDNFFNILQFLPKLCHVFYHNLPRLRANFGLNKASFCL